MEKIGLINGRLFRSGMTDMAVTNLLFKKGILTGMGYLPDDDTDTVDAIECAKKVLVPNIVDAGFRLRDRRDLDAALAGGVTAVLCLEAGQCLDHPEAIRALMYQIAETDGPRVFPVGAITKQHAGKELAEMGLMRLEGVAAFTDHRPIADPEVMKYALQYAAMLGVPLIVRPLGVHVMDMNAGWTSTRLGLRGEDPIVEELAVARDIELVRAYGGSVVFFPITSKGALERIADAKRRGIAVYCGTAPHYLWFSDAAVESYNTMMKVSPPLRGSFDQQALIEGIRQHHIDFLASDHIPALQDEKRTDFASAAFGMSTIDVFLPSLITRLHHQENIPLETLFTLVSAAVDQTFQLKLPRVSVSASPSITVVDPMAEYKVTPDSLRSSSSANPFLGTTLSGRAIGVFIQGQYKTFSSLSGT
ncbi:MAG: dihydroorotase [Candidatus Margulisiibacteriota bacterium]